MMPCEATVVKGKDIEYDASASKPGAFAVEAEQEWVDRTKRFFKAEMKRRDVTYEELARRLSEMGLSETKASISNKISRGGFSAVFFLASMKAIGCAAVKVEDL